MNVLTLLRYNPAFLAQLDEFQERLNNLNTTDLLYLGGIIVLGLFIARMTFRRAEKSRQRSERSVQEKISDGYNSRQTFEQMHELMANLADLSRQINGQIDTRISRLQILLNKSDEQIAWLEQRLSQLETTAEKPPGIAGASANEEPANTPANESGACEGHESAEPPEKLQPVEITPDMQQVIDLREEGHDTVAIAQELNRPVGEIELILSLTGHKKPKA